jgi:hypothetical protein
MPRLPVDLEKVRAELPRMKRGSLLILVERALELVPRSKLQELLKGHIKADAPKRADVPKRGDVPKRADAPKQAAKTLVLAEVKRFHSAVVARRYYEGFNVNSKNYREKSPGTLRFIDEFDRIEKLCLKGERQTPPAELRAALELLFDLLEQIDNGRPIVFFADEAGAWQVGADDKALMLLYIRALSKTADAATYLPCIEAALKKLGLTHDRKAYIDAAKLAVTDEQRKGLGVKRAGKGAKAKKVGAATARGRRGLTARREHRDRSARADGPRRALGGRSRVCASAVAGRMRC